MISRFKDGRGMHATRPAPVPANQPSQLTNQKARSQPFAGRCGVRCCTLFHRQKCKTLWLGWLGWLKPLFAATTNLTRFLQKVGYNQPHWRFGGFAAFSGLVSAGRLCPASGCRRCRTLPPCSHAGRAGGFWAADPTVINTTTIINSTLATGWRNGA
jgi:hypothetical protein